LKYSIFTGLLIFLASGLFAQDEVTFRGIAKQQVTVGETFQLTYTLNAQGTNFRGPRISGGLSVLTGPNTSTTSSIRSINGKTTMTITYTFGYILQATHEGTFDLPSATVVVEGKSYRSNTMRIKVLPRSAGNVTTRPGNHPASGNQNPGQNNQPQSVQRNQTNSDDVFLRAYVSDAGPIQGEGIIVTYKLFTRVPIAQISISKLSSFRGFWSQNMLKDNERFPQYNQTINGEQYVVAEIRKIALYPLKSGKLTIEPLEVECVAQIRQQRRQRTGDPFFDDFFNNSFFSSSYASVEKTLQSNPLNINVRPLPAKGKPADFSGAVGSFRFQSELDTQQVKTNEPFTLKFLVSGTGNIQLIDQLDVTFPPDFEVYDPKIVSDYNTTASGVTGMQSFEYLIIPRKAGDFAIKPVTFSYYDLAKKQYRTMSSPEYHIHVEKGSGEGTLTTYSGASKEEIRYIGSDIRHIVSKPFVLVPVGTLFYGSVLYFLLLGIPFLLFLVLLIFFRKRAAMRQDVVMMKTRKAKRVATRRLKRADELRKSGSEEAFYEEISQALWGYLSDKFAIPKAELSMDTVKDALMSKEVDEALINQFTATLEDTEFARFAPGDKTMRMDEIYGKAMEVIEGLASLDR
jgi:uncharacterized membrane protein